MTGFRYLPPHLAERLRDATLTLSRPLATSSIQGAHRARTHGAAVEFADYRAYAPGDPPQLIDWKVYARSDRHLVRRFEEETRLTAWILLDESESLAFREAGTASKAEQACAIAAALSLVLVQQRDRVGLQPFAAELAPPVAPAGDFALLPPLLRRLEALRFAGRSRIADCLHRFAEGGHGAGLVIVISDFLEDADELRGAFTHLVHAGHALRCYQVLDRAELLLPYEGLAEVQALERGGSMLVELDQVRDAYVREVQRHLDAVRRACADVGGHHRLAFTDEAVEAVVRDERGWA